jgi:hypothetical protein
VASPSVTALAVPNFEIFRKHKSCQQANIELFRLFSFGYFKICLKFWNCKSCWVNDTTTIHTYNDFIHNWGERYLMGENLKVVWAKFSTLS